MDLFQHVSIEDFNRRFLTELNAVTEFTQYNDPHDFFDPEQQYGEHIMRCQESELDFIRSTMDACLAAHGITLTPERYREIFQSKREEIIRSRPDEIDRYIERIAVTYIDSEINECGQKYLFHRMLCRIGKFFRSLPK